MAIKKVEEQYIKINNHISNKEIKNALDLIKEMIRDSRQPNYIPDYEKLNETYKFILKYTIKDVKDPQRPEIYRDLQLSILNLADRLKNHIIINAPEFQTMQLANEQTKAENMSGNQLNEWFQELKKYPKIPGEILAEPESTKRDQILENLFKWMWIKPDFTENDLTFTRKLISDDNIPWHEKCL